MSLLGETVGEFDVQGRDAQPVAGAKLLHRPADIGGHLGWLQVRAVFADGHVHLVESHFADGLQGVGQRLAPKAERGTGDKHGSLRGEYGAGNPGRTGGPEPPSRNQSVGSRADIASAANRCKRIFALTTARRGCYSRPAQTDSGDESWPTRF